MRHASALLCIGLSGLASAGVTQELLVGTWTTNEIRRYDPATGDYLGALVPSGFQGLSTPDGMVLHPDGRTLLVSNSGGNRIMRFDVMTGAFLGDFASAGLNAPGNMNFGPDGLLYVCDKNDGEVVRYDPETGAYLGSFASSQLSVPVGLSWANGEMYVSDFNRNRIVAYDAQTGAFDRVVYATTNLTPLIQRIDSDGSLLVSSHQLDLIRRIDPLTGAVLSARAFGDRNTNCPVGHVQTEDGRVIVANWLDHNLLQFDAQTGASLGVIALGEGLMFPNDLLLVTVPGQATWLIGPLAVLLGGRRRRG